MVFQTDLDRTIIKMSTAAENHLISYKVLNQVVTQLSHSCVIAIYLSPAVIGSVKKAGVIAGISN